MTSILGKNRFIRLAEDYVGLGYKILINIILINMMLNHISKKSFVSPKYIFRHKPLTFMTKSLILM